MEIPDANLRGALKVALVSWEAITGEELAALVRLEAGSANIRDLTGLEFATGLTHLDLGWNDISDLSPLSGLTRLTYLDLEENDISDLSPLSGLTRLGNLDFSENDISDLSPLSGLTRLSHLDLSGNEITDLSPLSGLTSLTWVNLRRNNLNYSHLAPYVPALESRGVVVVVDFRIPARLIPLAGECQSGRPGTFLAEPLVVEVVDEDGVPISGVPVRFAVISGTGALANADTVTGADGYASTNWRLGIGGRDSLEVSIPGNPSVSPVTFSPDLSVLPGDYRPVIIPDHDLRAALNEELGASSKGKAITEAELATVRRLEATDAGILDLTGLEFATGLITLILDWEYVDHQGILHSNSIADLSPLAGLPRLGHLHLSKTETSDLSPLSDLTSLVHLNLYWNEVSDVSPLSGLVNLIYLDLGNNEVSDVSGLSGLIKLTYLDLTRNQVSDVSGLSGLINLTHLNFYENEISDVLGLSGLVNLIYLNLCANEISDVSPLSGMTRLEELYLCSSAEDLSPLAGMSELRKLSFGGRMIRDLSPLAGMTKLQELSFGGSGGPDLSPLAGLPDLTRVSIWGNLSYPTLYTQVPALRSRGVKVRVKSRVPDRLLLFSGDGQPGSPGALLAEPLVVKVLDENWEPFVGVPVRFAVTAGGGALARTDTVSGDYGRASTAWRLGVVAGRNTVEVSIPGHPSVPPVTFSPSGMPSHSIADFDRDGAVDLRDFFRFADLFGSAGPGARIFDLNRNGKVDFPDFFLFQEEFRNSRRVPVARSSPGDGNGPSPR